MKCQLLTNDWHEQKTDIGHFWCYSRLSAIVLMKCVEQFVISIYRLQKKETQTTKDENQMNIRNCFQVSFHANDMQDLTIKRRWASKKQENEFNWNWNRNCPRLWWIVQLWRVYLKLTDFYIYKTIALSGIYWVLNLLRLKSFMSMEIKRLKVSLKWVKYLR